MKGMLKATGSGKLLKTKPEDVLGEDSNDMQEMAVNTVMLYLQSHVIRQLEEYGDCLLLFEVLTGSTIKRNCPIDSTHL